MIESLNTGVFEYKKLKPEEMQQRGILGRLIGVMADTVNPTRNGRRYSNELWENVFNNPIMKERIENNCCFGELGHPLDREETDMSKIAICMDGLPKKDSNGKLQAVFNILDTPNGRILKTLCDYGCNIGISSRGSGDLITDFDGNEAVDPDTYNCEGWDAVLIPAVKEARLTYVTEALNKKRYNKSLKSKLQETVLKENADDQKAMTESLNRIGISLKEDNESESNDKSDIGKTADINNNMEDNKNDFFYKGIEIIKSPDTEKFICEIDGESYSFNTEKNAKLWIDLHVKNKISKSSYIKTLPKNTRDSIENELSKVLSSDEDIKKGMDGRLSDIEDTIDISRYLKEEQVGRDSVKDDKNVDDVLKPDTEDSSEKENSEEDKKEDKIVIKLNEDINSDNYISEFITTCKEKLTNTDRTDIELEIPNSLDTDLFWMDLNSEARDNGLYISLQERDEIDDSVYLYFYVSKTEEFSDTFEDQLDSTSDSEKDSEERAKRRKDINGLNKFERELASEVQQALDEKWYKDLSLREVINRVYKDEYFDADAEYINIDNIVKYFENIEFNKTDWERLNSTEQFCVEAVIDHLNNDSSESLIDLVRQAVQMYNEVNAFESGEEDFAAEEANEQNVYNYIINNYSLKESLKKFLKEDIDDNVYPVEFTYTYETDDTSEDFIGNINVKANSKEEALEKAEKYVNSNKYGNEHYNRYHFRNFKIANTKYTNVDLVEDVDDIQAARYQLATILDNWYEDNIANEKSSDVKLAGWDSDLQDRYLSFRNYLVPDIAEFDKTSMDVVGNTETDLDSFYEMLKHNKDLEKHILVLNEKLSVSYAKEKSLQESIEKYKEKISLLSKTSKENKVLNEQLVSIKDSVSNTEKQFKEYKEKNSLKLNTLKEQLNTISKERDSKEAELVSLKEDYEVITRDLNQTKEQFNKRFERQNKLLERYQKITRTAVDRYINVQAVNLGVKPVEIKNRLSENFTFNDIDSVCEDLRNYKLNISKLPFNTSTLNENVNIKATNFDRNNLIPKTEVDELTDYDLRLMEVYL